MGDRVPGGGCGRRSKESGHAADHPCGRTGAEHRADSGSVAAQSLAEMVVILPRLPVWPPSSPEPAQKHACGASTWATTGSSLVPSRWWNTRKRHAPTQR